MSIIHGFNKLYLIHWPNYLCKNDWWAPSKVFRLSKLRAKTPSEFMYFISKWLKKRRPYAIVLLQLFRRELTGAPHNNLRRHKALCCRNKVSRGGFRSRIPEQRRANADE